jgi:polyvinyl alcohol dehydrogenase (cytochrome)
MKEKSEGINDPTKRRIAEFLSGRPMGSSPAGDAKNMPNKCAQNPAMTDPAAAAGWNGWGNDNSNTRFQPATAARLTAADVPRLKVKWAFGFPKGETTSSQPTIVSGRVFVGSDNGYIYSLDAATGCVYWSFEGGSIVRGSLTVGAVTGAGNARYAVFYGDGHANIYAVNAQDGRMLWKTKVDSHIVARITAGLRYYNGRVYVPVSSSEGIQQRHAGLSLLHFPWQPGLARCQYRKDNLEELGRAWRNETLQDPIQRCRVVRASGGGVWNSPTIDPVRQVVYISTGDATTFPAPNTTDGVIAVDSIAVKIAWAYQADEKDVFMGGCNGAVRSEACPNPMGPDLDIGNSPILKSLPGGKRALIVGTKRGHVIALDPDNKGAVLYRVFGDHGPTRHYGRRTRREYRVGGAADDQNVYYGAGGAAGLVALRLATGDKAWAFTPPQGGSLGAAPTVIPGVVFEGASNGRLFAVSTADGKSIWDFNTAQEFTTVNKVPAHGGAISVSGA